MSIQDLKPAVRPFYRDEYIVEQDEMGDSGASDYLIRYLVRVLEWLYRVEQWMITVNRNHYHNAVDNSQKLIVPDIAVFKGIEIPPEQQLLITSWDMRKDDKKAPPLVIESSSQSTYEGDIEPDKKPRLYGLIGVKEYFSYDPNNPRVWPKSYTSRLLGWCYDEKGIAHPILPNEGGWLWSEVLESWLVPDGSYLRLYDREGNIRLTEAEAEAKARQEEAEARRREAKAHQAEVLARQDEAKARKEAEQKIAELQRQLEELRRQSGKEQG
jgi:Uma2 family endonuclease